MAVLLRDEEEDIKKLNGWSYCGVLPSYLIATTTKFKAATSPAGVAFPLAFYGHDQHIHQYDNKIGSPWKSGLVIRSFTPTASRRQRGFCAVTRISMSRCWAASRCTGALRNAGVDSELIIYPRENHGIARSNFQRDRMQRYLDWYKKYL